MTKKRSATSINSGNYSMSRGYPRFLYSNPQNTKDKGPFVISTLPPHVIVKIRWDANETSHTIRTSAKLIYCCDDYYLEKLNFISEKELLQYRDQMISNRSLPTLNETWDALKKWLKFQVKIVNHEVVLVD